MNQTCLRNTRLRFRFFRKNSSYSWTGCVWEISSWGLGSLGKNTSYKWMGWVWEINGRGLRLQKINHHKWTRRVWKITSWSSRLHKVTNHSWENLEVSEEKQRMTTSGNICILNGGHFSFPDADLGTTMLALRASPPLGSKACSRNALWRAPSTH